MRDFTVPHDVRGGAEATNGRSSAGWLLPILAADATIPPELDAQLTAVAAIAHAGNVAARDTLFAALQPKLQRSARRCYRWSRGQSPAWDLDDLDQESFLVFAALLANWPGNGSFSAYFFSRFPHRLNDTVRRGSGFRSCCPPQTTNRPRQTDPRSLDERSLRHLESLAVALPARDADLLRLHVRDHLTFQEIARRQGRHPLTIRRNWHALLPTLRRLLAEHDAV